MITCKQFKIFRIGSSRTWAILCDYEITEDWSQIRVRRKVTNDVVKMIFDREHCADIIFSTCSRANYELYWSILLSNNNFIKKKMVIIASADMRQNHPPQMVCGVSTSRAAKSDVCRTYRVGLLKCNLFKFEIAISQLLVDAQRSDFWRSRGAVTNEIFNLVSRTNFFSVFSKFSISST